MKTVQYTSTLSAEIMKLLDGYAAKFTVPKNRIIEAALRAYFDNLKKADYINSFRKASQDEEVANMAEEGFEEYLKILEDQ